MFPIRMLVSGLCLVVVGLDCAVRPVHARAGDQADSRPARRFPDYRAIRHERFVRNIACGPLSLLAVIDELGEPLSAEQRSQLIGLAGQRGVDLLSLKRHATHLGLAAVGILASPDQLRAIRIPAVVYLSERGFAAVTDYRADAFRLTLPGQQRQWWSDAEFSRRFGERGVALLVDDRPISVSDLGIDDASLDGVAGSPLQFEFSLLPVGRISSANWSAEVRVFNRGQKPLRVLDMVVSCPCVNVSLDHRTLLPGGVALLRATGNQSRNGTFLHTIALVTDCPEQPVASIRASGYREPSLTFPEPAILATAYEGKAFSCSAEVDLPPAEASDGFECVAHPTELPIGARLVEEDGTHRVSVECSEGLTPGWTRVEILVRRRGEDVVLGRLPIAIHVRPRVEVFPTSLSISAAELKSGWERRVRILVHQEDNSDVGPPEHTWASASVADGSEVLLSEVFPAESTARSFLATIRSRPDVSSAELAGRDESLVFSVRNRVAIVRFRFAP